MSALHHAVICTSVSVCVASHFDISVLYLGINLLRDLCEKRVHLGNLADSVHHVSTDESAIALLFFNRLL